MDDNGFFFVIDDFLLFYGLWNSPDNSISHINYKAAICFIGNSSAPVFCVFEVQTFPKHPAVVYSKCQSINLRPCVCSDRRTLIFTSYGDYLGRLPCHWVLHMWGISFTLSGEAPATNRDSSHLFYLSELHSESGQNIFGKK